MSPTLILSIIAIYFLVLILISYFTGKSDSNDAFFLGNKQSPWYIVSFGMIGATLSGVTFISVPGWVADSQFSYLQMILGMTAGYVVIANVLMPIYYRMNLTSIYAYLGDRFGESTHQTGAFFFLLSRTIGASFRLYLVANVMQIAIFDAWNVPFWLTVSLTIILIWIYTFRSGIKTIIWTDTLQTLFMLLAVGVSIWLISDKMGLGLVELSHTIRESQYSQVFFWEGKQHFLKQFLSGAFLAIVMTGLDQDMMQKNLSCRSLSDAKKNMYSFSVVLIVVNIFFLALGAMLYLYAEQIGMDINKGDDLFPLVALKADLGLGVGIFFILGLIAAAYSSADSALTSLTTSFCVDFLNIEQKAERQQVQTRKWVHVGFSVVLVLAILIFKAINDDSVISALFKVAGYTYGPLLGLFAFGIFTKWNIKDRAVPIVAVLSPVIAYILQLYIPFGFELLMVNGGITFLGLCLLIKRA
ncbi:MAG: sodium:solute symporter [Flavobacteriales bacterium]|nr:sodium:solute symporter [Flavobacteriales bacterium]